MSSCGTSSVPCANLAPCSGGACSCAVGYFGALCENRWKDTDVTAWTAVQFTLVALNAVLLVGCIVLVCQYWVKRSVVFPRFNKAMMALATLAASSVFGVLTYAIDPYRFIASASGTLTQSYRAGMSLLSNLFLALLACAYLFLAASWLTIMTSEGRWARDEWSTPARVGFFAGCAYLLFVAGLCAGLWMVLGTSLADSIFMAFLGVAAIVISVTVLVGAIATVRDLQRFQGKNKTLTRTVATHAIVVVVCVAICITLLAACSLGPVNSSFGAFLYVRTLLPGLSTVALRLVLMWHYRYRPRVSGASSQSPAELSASSNKSPTLKGGSGSVLDDAEGS